MRCNAPTCELENLCGEILHNGSDIHRCLGPHPHIVCILAPEKPARQPDTDGAPTCEYARLETAGQL